MSNIDPDSNQHQGQVSGDLQHVLIETSQGNGVIISQLPGVEVGFQYIDGTGAVEKEVQRTVLDNHTDKQIENLRELSKTHTLKFDTISSSIITIPKPTMQQTNNTQPGA